MFLGPNATYMEANTQNDGKTKKKGLGRTHMSLGHCEFHTHMCLGHVVCTPCTEKVRDENVFSCFLWVKSAFSSQTHMAYNYRLPSNLSLVIMCN